MNLENIPIEHHENITRLIKEFDKVNQDSIVSRYLHTYDLFEENSRKDNNLLKRSYNRTRELLKVEFPKLNNHH
jgi:hypothetical protein